MSSLDGGFLTLNGVSFPCAVADAQPVLLGDVERASDLSPRAGVRAKAWDLACATGELTLAESRALQQLVSGEGHVLNFEDTTTAYAWRWTSRGTPPTVNTGTRLLGDARYGSACFRAGGLGGGARYPVGARVTTVLGWVRPSGLSWTHVLKVFSEDTATATYLNGVLLSGHSPAADAISMSGGLVSLVVPNTAAPSVVDWDDCVVLPFAIPAEWVPAVYAFHNRSPWPALPYCLVEGAAVPSGALEVLGRLGTVRRLVGGTPGTWRESFEFTLVSSAE